MARLVTCGFELGDDSAGVLNDEAGSGGHSGLAFSTSVVRSGDRSLQCSLDAAQRYSGFDFLSAVSTGPFYIRAYFYVDAFPGAETTILSLGDAASQHAVRATLGSTGTLTLYDEDGSIGTSTLAEDTWTRVELEYSGVGGAGGCIAGLYKNGISVVRATNRSITQQVKSGYAGVNINSEGVNTGGPIYVDDLAINDSSGSIQANIPGEGKVIYLRPNGEGDADAGTPLRGGADSGTDYGQLDETTPNDATDYIILDVNPCDVWVDVVDGSTYGITGGDRITLVEVNGKIAGATGNAANWFPQIKATSGGSITSAGAIGLGSATWFTNDDTAPRTCKLVTYLDPLGAAWTPTTVNSMQISAKTTDGNPDTWVTAIWAIVEFVPQPFPFRRGSFGQDARLRR